MTRVRRLSNAATLSVIGLVLTAAGMLLQVAAGSELYPTFAGPIVLLAAAVIVAFGSGRWTPYVALLVPLVLGEGCKYPRGLPRRASTLCRCSYL